MRTPRKTGDELNPLVLDVLAAERESHGYAIGERVGERSGDRPQRAEGLLYPLLHRLERLGYVESSWRTTPAGRPRRYYRRTEQAGLGRRAASRGPVVAFVTAAVLVAGAGVAAAADWLPIFRAEQVASVTAADADLVRLPDLSAFGELEVTEQVDLRPVADAAAAARETGLSVPRVGRLPRGVTGEPAYRVTGRVSAEFTFSAAKTAQSAAAAGRTLPPPPPGLDGGRFRLVAGPGLVAVWAKGRGVPTMVLGRAVAPTAYSTGVPFAAARDYLLSLPMLPEQIAAQLRGFSGDGTTLPLLVPGDRLTTATADVNGRPATVLTARNGALAGVVWVDGGVVTALAGSLSPDEVLSVARDLRWER
ncbi:PadR family transcriptional regulator [Catellatospora sp. NPDC049609]|uniref:PadR family transcriptional regulator n=1 Tax=Catellatospora sp. NPDC049609 TaxID=3155505 RepID=UPI0034239282